MHQFHEVSFEKLGPSHLETLQGWLNTPHVNPWWGDKEWTSADVHAKYMPYTHETAKVRAYIILIGPKAVGYIQYYKVRDFAEGLPFHITDDMVGVDFMVGDKAVIGTGVSRHALILFMSQVIPGKYSKIIADPISHNTRACKFLEKCGFETFIRTAHHVYYIKNLPASG